MCVDMPDKGLYNMSNMFETLSVANNSFISTKLFQNASFWKNDLYYMTFTDELLVI